MKSSICLLLSALPSFAGLPPQMQPPISPQEQAVMDEADLRMMAFTAGDSAALLAMQDALRAPGDVAALWAGGAEELCLFLRASLLLYAEDEALRGRIEALFGRMLDDPSVVWDAPAPGEAAALGSPLGLLLWFAARHPRYESLALKVAQQAAYDVHAHPGGLSLPAWAILADSPPLLELFLQRGADVRGTACADRLFSYNAFGLLVQSHSGYLRRVHTNNNAGLRLEPQPFAQRPRSHGLELAQLLDAAGCPLYVRRGEREFRLWPLLPAGDVVEQPGWPDLRAFLERREAEERHQAVEREGGEAVKALPLRGWRRQ